MSTYKRRIVYLSDEEWSALLAESKVRKQTASSLVRAWLRDGIDYGVLQASASARHEPTWKPSPEVVKRAAQLQRDDLLRKINRGK